MMSGAVRVVALDAIHFAFEHGMMLGRLNSAWVSGDNSDNSSRVFAGIENEFPAATANRRMLPGRDSFATTRAGGARHEVHPVGAGGEPSHVVGVAGQADEMRSGISAEMMITGTVEGGIGTGDQRRRNVATNAAAAPATPYLNLLLVCVKPMNRCRG